MTLILSDALPWYTWDCVHWLEEWLKPDMQVWEWGSGGSTLFFAQRVARVVSVEHDGACADKLRESLREFDLESKVELLVIPPEKGHIAEYESRDDAFLNTHNFRRYAQVIRDYDTFDLVAVDGRARNGCMKEGIAHVKQAILMDDIERKYYVRGADLVPREWKRTVYWGHGPYHWPEWGTSVWMR